VSRFSAVDQDPDPSSLIRFLDDAAVAESGMKHYVAAAHALRRSPGPILDLGCGVGHDLAVLHAEGARSRSQKRVLAIAGSSAERNSRSSTPSAECWPRWWRSPAPPTSQPG
jgi:hypothetical protein